MFHLYFLFQFPPTAANHYVLILLGSRSSSSSNTDTNYQVLLQWFHSLKPKGMSSTLCIHLNNIGSSADSCKHCALYSNYLETVILPWLIWDMLKFSWQFPNQNFYIIVLRIGTNHSAFNLQKFYKVTPIQRKRNRFSSNAYF